MRKSAKSYAACSRVFVQQIECRTICFSLVGILFYSKIDKGPNLSSLIPISRAFNISSILYFLIKILRLVNITDEDDQN